MEMILNSEDETFRILKRIPANQITQYVRDQYDIRGKVVPQEWDPRELKILLENVGWGYEEYRNNPL